MPTTFHSSAIGIPVNPPSDKHYEHIQGVPETEWVIRHPLRKYPSVTIVDSAGSAVIGDIKYTDIDTVTLTFAFAFSGKAFLN